MIDPAKLLDRARQLGAVSASEHEGSRLNPCLLALTLDTISDLAVRESSSRAFLGSGYSMSGENAEPVVKNEDPNKVDSLSALHSFTEPHSCVANHCTD